MTVYEMEGFLRGKCVPGDLKVNETNAEYLVRKFAELENKCAALVTENVRLKSGIAGLIHLGIRYADVDVMKIAGDAQLSTPCTDTFLAEVRAQGVEMFAQWCRGERDFTLIDEDVADAATYEECVKRAEYFSAQLRKR